MRSARIRVLTALAVLGLALPAAAPREPDPATGAEKFDFDAAHSEIGFSIRFMGLTNVRGRFKNFAGTVMYVANDVAKSTVAVLIDAKSIDTGNDMRDGDLRGSAFFGVDSFPTILFQSAATEQRGDGFVVRGPLTLHGVTREVAIPLALVHGKMKDAWGNTRIGFAGSVRLNRRDFGVFWNQVVDLSRVALADSVDVELSIEAQNLNFDRIGFGARPNTRSIGEAVLETITAKGADAGVARYGVLKRDSATAYSIGESQLNTLGYKLLQLGRTDDAIRVFALNVEAFPQSSNAYDSLGEAYLAKSDRRRARENYEKSLALDPQNVGAMEVLRWLR
ncbi:MAG: YceI family protein [Gemmatimonadales bacterium]